LFAHRKSIANVIHFFFRQSPFFSASIYFKHSILDPSPPLKKTPTSMEPSQGVEEPITLKTAFLKPSSATVPQHRHQPSAPTAIDLNALGQTGQSFMAARAKAQQQSTTGRVRYWKSRALKCFVVLFGLLLVVGALMSIAIAVKMMPVANVADGAMVKIDVMYRAFARTLEAVCTLPSNSFPPGVWDLLCAGNNSSLLGMLAPATTGPVASS
jgi:hypothetical protein